MSLMETAYSADQTLKETPSALYPRDLSGFTVIELLIALGIGILVFGVGALYLTTVRTSRSVESEARQIVSLLQSAQEKSIGQEQNSRWGVYFNNPASGQGWYALYQGDEALLSGGFTGVPGTTIQQLALRGGVSFSSPSSGSYRNVVFDRATGLPNASTTISIQMNQGGSTQKTVYISDNGRIEYR